MKTITVNKEQYLTLKAIGNACSKDLHRRVLNRIHYRADKKAVIACDGYILRQEPMDLGEENLFLDPGDLRLPIKKITEENEIPAIPCDSEEGKAVRPYPDTDHVIPKEPGKEIGSIPLDLVLLAQLSKTFVGKKKILLRFFFSGEYKAVSVYRADEEREKLIFCGIVMPLRRVLDSDQDEDKEIEKITAWKKQTETV